MAERPFAFAVEPSDDGEVVVRVSGDIDVAAESAFAGCLADARAIATHRIVVDLTAAEFMASTGLNVLVRASRSLPEGCTLVVRGARPAVRRVFEVTGLDSMLEA